MFSKTLTLKIILLSAVIAACLHPSGSGAAKPVIDKPDLVVAFISRSPRFPSMHGKVTYEELNKPILKDPEKDGSIKQFFPKEGDEITFTAHVTNKGTPVDGQVEYQWLIDGEPVADGRITPPHYNDYVEASFKWKWKEGPHTISFELDPGKTLDEFSRDNSTKTDRTDSLGLLFFCRRDAYDRWNANKNMNGTYSFEDWMNWHFDDMNRQFAAAKYPSTPDGCTERVHVAKFLVVDTPEEMGKVDHFGYSGYWDFRETNGPCDKPDGGLIHELGHQLGLIDQYAIVFPLFYNRLENKYGEPVMKGYEFYQPESNMQNPGAFKWSELSAGGLNRQKGYPRGYFGTYLFDHADNYSIRVLDSEGRPIPNAKVTYYRTINGLEKQQEGRTNRNGVMKLNNDKTPRYKIPYSPFELKPTPFGEINILGNCSILCFQVEANDQEDFAMSEAAWFLINHWRSGKDNVTVDIQTEIRPKGGPKTPGNVRAEWAPERKIKVSWDPVPGSSCKYNVYRMRLGASWGAYMIGPELVAEAVEGTSVECASAGESMKFFVTAVDEKGRESGTSRRKWAPMPRRMNESMSICWDDANGRIALSGGERVQSWSETSGFWPVSYWMVRIKGVTVNRDGNLLLAVGDVVQMLNLSTSTPSFKMYEYGNPESGLRMRDVTDVAVDGRDNLVIADTGNGRVLVVAKTGDLIAELGGEGPDDDQIQQPISVAILPDGTIVVGDAKRKQLVKCKISEDDVDYHAIHAWMKETPKGLMPDVEIDTPSDLVVDSSNNVYVVDTARKHVVKTKIVQGSETQAGELLHPEVIAKDLSNPTSLAICDGKLVVYDSGKEGMDVFVEIPGGTETGTRDYLQSLSDDRVRSFSCVPEKLWSKYAPPIDRNAWHIVGPFENSGFEGFAEEYPPEKEKRFDFSKSYEGLEGTVSWKKLPAIGCVDGLFVDLNASFVRNDYVCAYAAATLVSDSGRKVRILTGSDDTITMWVNGDKVVSKDVRRGSARGQDRTEVALKKGENSVLLKICEGGGGWGFFFELEDIETGGSVEGVSFKAY